MKPGLWWCALIAAIVLVMPTTGKTETISACPKETARAREARQKIQENWPTRSSADPVAKYVNRLAAQLLKARGITDQYSARFVIIRDRSINAYAIGGFQFILTDGTIAFVRNESELAAILAHEIAHQLAGHFCPKRSSLLDNFLDFFNPSNNDDHQYHQVGLLTQSVNLIKEQEADRLAVHLIKRSGFDPFAMLDVAKRLRITGGKAHIQNPQRIKALEDILVSGHKVVREDSIYFVQIKKLLAREGIMDNANG